MKCVQIHKDGTMDDLDISLKKLKTLINLKNCCKIIVKSAKSQGNNSLQELYKWSYEGKSIHCYGWWDGEAGFENKHELPPGGKSNFLEEDSSVKLLFGDIFLVQCKMGKILDFKVSDYGEFYNCIFGGFDDCDTETDEEDMNTEEEDDDYVQPSDNENENDTEDEYEILENPSDAELDEDDEDYTD